MNALLLLTVYCGLIMVVSVAGGRLSSLLRMTHLRTQLLMSGVGGLMLGIAMLHLMPHATETLGSAGRAGIGGLAGLTVMFLLVRLFHTHDHSVPAVDLREPNGSPSGHHAGGGPEPQPEQSCGLDHHGGKSAKRISWFGLFFGLLLHTVVDGIALSASVIAEYEHGAWLGLAGLGTFLAVALHKPLDAFAITSVMKRQHWSERARNGFPMSRSPWRVQSAPWRFYFGVSGLVGHPDLLGWGLAISAGFFIGIALADLLPEVAFHDHDRGKLTATFLLGIAIAVGIEQLPGHDHSIPTDQPAAPGHHSHGNHDHGDLDHRH